MAGLLLVAPSSWSPSGCTRRGNGTPVGSSLSSTPRRGNRCPGASAASSSSPPAGTFAAVRVAPAPFEHGNGTPSSPATSALPRPCSGGPGSPSTSPASSLSPSELPRPSASSTTRVSNPFVPPSLPLCLHTHPCIPAGILAHAQQQQSSRHSRRRRRSPSVRQHAKA